MIVHTIRAALASSAVDRVIVSTNDPAVARVARRERVEVLARPDELATDETPTLPVVQHAVHYAEADGARFDFVVTLQPTSPLRTAAHIDRALGMARDAGGHSIVSVAPLGVALSVVGGLANGRLRGIADSGDVRRQASPAAVRITGGIYVTPRHLLDEGRLLDADPLALLLDEAAAVDVDTMDDLAAARRWWRAARR
jgi:CMP-N-acetylneuraminic acid synthetase